MENPTVEEPAPARPEDAPPEGPAKKAKPKPRCPHAHLWLRPTPPKGFKLPAFLRKLGLQQPDCRRNPALWITRWVYGDNLLNQSLELASRAQSILIVGDTLPWLTWEVARRNPQARVLAIDSNARSVEWAQQHFQERWPGQLDIVNITTDFQRLLEPTGEQSFDLILWNFVADATPSAEKGPGRAEILEAGLRQLAQGGQFVYYEATEPSPLNLERWSRWRHFWARLSGHMSDPWNQRRAIEGLYREDALRSQQNASLEAGLFQTLQAALHIEHHRRNRPLVDTLLTDAGRFWLTFEFIRLWDHFVLTSGWLDGSCRFAILNKKA